jgi:hypothetical protein
VEITDLVLIRDLILFEEFLHSFRHIMVNLARPARRRRRRRSNSIKRFELLPELIYLLMGHMYFLTTSKGGKPGRRQVSTVHGTDSAYFGRISIELATVRSKKVYHTRIHEQGLFL